MKIAALHINCDLGEGMANEAAIFPYIDACNLACGGHFGTKGTLAKSMQQALNTGSYAGPTPVIQT